MRLKGGLALPTTSPDRGIGSTKPSPPASLHSPAVPCSPAARTFANADNADRWLSTIRKSSSERKAAKTAEDWVPACGRAGRARTRCRWTHRRAADPVRPRPAGWGPGAPERRAEGASPSGRARLSSSRHPFSPLGTRYLAVGSM